MQAKKRSRGVKSGKEEAVSPVRECSSEEEGKQEETDEEVCFFGEIDLL